MTTHPLRILILDDEPKMGKILSRVLSREGHEVEALTNPHQAIERIEENAIDLLLSDLKMPEMSGIEVLRKIKEGQSSCDVVMMTAYATAETAVEAMKLGAFDYLIKPFPNDEMIMMAARVAEHRYLKTENRMLRETIQSKFQPENLVAASSAMRDVLKRVEKVAASDVTVLLRGESGTGKEVLANAIHAAGPRKNKPLVKVNCGALPDNLLESELFGHTRGAFTGAIETRKGLFQEAEGGTIFLDEIGEVTPALQVKLLRVLQSGEFQRVGDAKTFNVDVRVLAATNRPLEQMIENGEFRSDLYYRLNVVPIQIPPLRERPDDIPALIDHFLGRLRERYQKQINLAGDAYQKLVEYHWPGNIRELENALEHAWVMCEGNKIQIADLPVAVQNRAVGAESPAYNSSSTNGSHPVQSTEGRPVSSTRNQTRSLEDLEKQALIDAMEACHYNQTRAAKKLGITRRTLGYRLNKYNIPRHPDDLEALESE